MELRSFVKYFTWEEPDRAFVTLGADTRLNPETNRAQLGTFGSASYSTADDLYVKSRLTNPTAVRQWQGFEATVIQKNDLTGAQVTSAGFRLFDGTDQYWWNGSAWQISSANWNTEAEIATNISTFSATSRKLQVVVNLKTTDSAYTPELVEVKVLYGALLDSEIEDMVVRSIVPSLKANLRPVTRYIVAMPATGTTLDLDDFPTDTDYDIVGVHAVFNDDTDPDHDIDILDNYNTGTKVITLTGSVNEDTNLWLRLVYKPMVAVTTSRDYVELDKIPSIIIEDIRYNGATESTKGDFVGNKGLHSAKVLPGPLQGDLVMTMTAITDKLVDHMKLAAAVKRYFGNRPTIASTGLDESYTMSMLEEHEFIGQSSEEELHTWRATFRVANFNIWTRDVEDGYLVERFNIQADFDLTIQ